MRGIGCGLDISDYSVELIALQKSGGEIQIDRCARVAMPPGLIRHGVVQDAAAVGLVIKKLLAATYGQQRPIIAAGIGLPEAVVYAKRLKLPATLNRVLAEKAALMQVREYFPINIRDAVIDIMPLRRIEDTQEAYLMAVEKSTIAGYETALRAAGVKPLFYDAESLASVRALVPKEKKTAVLVADIGARSTLMSVADDGVVSFTSSSYVGGDELTEAIEKGLKLPLDEAEKLKIQVGLNKSEEHAEVQAIIKLAFDEIIKEMRRTVDFFEKQSGHTIEEIILAGGTSLMKGALNVLVEAFPGHSVIIGDPFQSLSLARLPHAAQVRNTSLLYASATGLALRASGFTRDGPLVNFSLSRSVSFLGYPAWLKKIVHRMQDMIKKTTRKNSTRKKAKDVAADPTPEMVPETLVAPVSETVDAPAEKADETTVTAEPKVEPLTEPPIQDRAVVSRKQLLPTIESKPEPEVPVKPTIVVPEEPDFGQNVGELLGQSVGVSDKASRDSEPMVGGGNLKIHEILARKKTPTMMMSSPEPEEPEEVAAEEEAPIVEETKRGPTVILVVLAIIFIVAAAAGTYMFISRNGLSSIPFIGQRFATTTTPAITPVVPTAPVDQTPTAVSVVLRLSVKEETSDTMPVVSTKFIDVDQTEVGTFSATGTATTTGTGRASGTIKIVNTTSETYTFVARTRFLTSDGVLFRMKQSTVIPANGSVETAVAADQTGPTSDIGPTKFTIPGLLADLQTKIWGESSQSMSGGGSTAKAVTVADLAGAKAALTETIKVKAEAALREAAGIGMIVLPELITAEEVSVDAPKEGDVATEFTMKLTLKYKALLIPEAEIETHLAKQLANDLPSGTTVADFGLAAPTYTIEAYDAEVGQAELRAQANVTR